jgi:hypothetical protein
MYTITWDTPPILLLLSIFVGFAQAGFGQQSFYLFLLSSRYYRCVPPYSNCEFVFHFFWGGGGRAMLRFEFRVSRHSTTWDPPAALFALVFQIRSCFSAQGWFWTGRPT